VYQKSYGVRGNVRAIFGANFGPNQQESNNIIPAEGNKVLPFTLNDYEKGLKMRVPLILTTIMRQ
jgi:hypothetical protein